MAEELKVADAPTWAQFILNFDKASKSFTDNRAALVAITPYLTVHHPELLPQQKALIAQGNELAAKLEQLRSVRNTASSWIGSLGKTASALYTGAVDLTSRGIEAAANAIASARKAIGLGDAPPTELGVVPLVVFGAAAALAALVAIAKWITDAYVLAQRVNALQALEQKGYRPADAAAAVNKALGDPAAPSGFERIASQVVWVAGIGLFAVFVVPKLLQEWSAKKR